MLFNLERLSLSLQHHADVNVKGRSVRRKGGIICVLHISSRPFRIVRRHVLCRIIRIKILKAEEPALTVNLRIAVTVAVYDHNRRHPCLLSHLVVVRSEGRRDVDNARRTFLNRNIVTSYHAESAVRLRAEPWNELVVLDSEQFAALELSVKNLERNEFVASLVALHRELGSLRVEPTANQSLGDYIDCLLTRIGIERLHADIVDVRPYTESRI